MVTPYAGRTTDMTPAAHSICRDCGVRVEIVERKDFESFTRREMWEHYRTAHPDKITHDDGGRPIGYPYHSIYFD